MRLRATPALTGKNEKLLDNMLMLAVHSKLLHSAGGCPTLTNMLVIIVGGIPIAMPTVLSVTLALGAYKLAKEGAIVARMSAVEEMAGMDILCSDKTGLVPPSRANLCHESAQASHLVLHTCCTVWISNTEHSCMSATEEMAGMAVLCSDKAG